MYRGSTCVKGFFLKFLRFLLTQGTFRSSTLESRLSFFINVKIDDDTEWRNEQEVLVRVTGIIFCFSTQGSFLLKSFPIFESLAR